MSTYASGRDKSARTTVRHSKDDALTDQEYELLLEGAGRLDDYYALQAQFAIVAAGRLGLRRGEITHLRASWIDPRQEMVTIPRQQDCETGRDGDVCGYCRQLAEQEAEVNDHVTLEGALANRWSPKTDAAARDVYYGFDARVRLYVERYLDRFGGWQWSANAVARRLDKAATAADGLSPDDVRPHALRATAATYHAARGLEMHALMQYFGWAQPSTAEVYLARNGQNTARQLDAIHSG